MQPRPPTIATLLPLLLGLALGACQPAIGDSCDTSLDCSAQNNRYCDQTQPGGYCTLPECDTGTCPEDSVCVRFRPAEPRLSAAFCMASCDNGSDCRGDEGYRCLSETSFGQDGLMEAKVLEGSSNKFCAQPAAPLASTEESSEGAADSTQEAGSDDS